MVDGYGGVPRNQVAAFVAENPHRPPFTRQNQFRFTVPIQVAERRSADQTPSLTPSSGRASSDHQTALHSTAQIRPFHYSDTRPADRPYRSPQSNPPSRPRPRHTIRRPVPTGSASWATTAAAQNH